MGDVIGIRERVGKKLDVKKDDDEGLTFEQIEKKNKEKAEKLAKERNQANKSVLRSYRIKDT